ncbi:three-Cys-motif partner protein TcmP [Dehalogenimonas sp. THU2]|uniref:three-Cys-motif partner protein TcmP n=1 Tax=Dehalogenimonas sp. THU2 TaxID=3151121 RepID=UPI00321886AD
MCDRCKSKPNSDGYPLLELGPWAKNKLHYLRYYSSLFTNGMKSRWPETVYLDLFAGPGLCTVRGTGETIQGSPMIALSQMPPFTHYVFVDSDKSHINSLNARSQSINAAGEKLILPGNCNNSEIINKIVNFIPPNALCLAFIDPFTWDIDFKTLRALTGSRRVDIILVFQIGGIKRAIESSTTSLDQFFGDDGKWRKLVANALPNQRTRSLLDHYRHQLSSLGYLGQQYPTEVSVVNTKNVPLYYMVFATKHPRGQDFWQKAIHHSATGTRTLPGF